MCTTSSGVQKTNIHDMHCHCNLLSLISHEYLSISTCDRNLPSIILSYLFLAAILDKDDPFIVSFLIFPLHLVGWLHAGCLSCVFSMITSSFGFDISPKRATCACSNPPSSSPASPLFVFAQHSRIVYSS